MKSAVFGWAAFIGLTTKRSDLFMRTELFNEILDKVAKVTELNTEEILKSNKEECVDARYILVGVLCDRLTDSDMAKLTGWKRQTVNHIRNGVELRKKYRWSVKVGIESIKQLIINL